MASSKPAPASRPASTSKPLALISVTDKRGIQAFAAALVQKGFELVSTGGTAKALRDAGIPVLDVASLTGFPEMLDGRVKTLHPIIHAGLLGDRQNPEHLQVMEEAGINGIALAAVNLYAFEQKVSKPHKLEEAIESIDIGGPTMVRAAAKNYRNVMVVVDPEDYPKVLEHTDAGPDDPLRLQLSAKAFRHAAFYDSAISRYLTEATGADPLDMETLTMGFRRVSGFRYGENPHQKGSLYADPLAARTRQKGLPQAKLLWGKELSFNNIGDAASALELVADLPAGACAVIKHGNPCGAAASGDAASSWRDAKASDPVSAFGGIAAFNSEVDLAAAEAMTEKGNFLEVVVAPKFSSEALACFKGRTGWGQDVRLLKSELPGSGLRIDLRTVRGGAVAQTSDEDPGESAWKVVTQKQPTAEQLDAAKFLWKVIPHVRSNAIIVGAGTRLLGVGAGQMNRVQSVRLALEQAGDAKGCVLASDAFFPFPDSVETAAAAGIGAVIQPGGSKKDQAVIEAADRLGIAMIFTGTRHFRH